MTHLVESAILTDVYWIKTQNLWVRDFQPNFHEIKQYDLVWVSNTQLKNENFQLSLALSWRILKLVNGINF